MLTDRSAHENKNYANTSQFPSVHSRLTMPGSKSRKKIFARVPFLSTFVSNCQHKSTFITFRQHKCNNFILRMSIKKSMKIHEYPTKSMKNKTPFLLLDRLIASSLLSGGDVSGCHEVQLLTGVSTRGQQYNASKPPLTTHPFGFAGSVPS
jgi:hypothetical protein